MGMSTGSKSGSKDNNKSGGGGGGSVVVVGHKSITIHIDFRKLFIHNINTVIPSKTTPAKLRQSIENQHWNNGLIGSIIDSVRFALQCVFINWWNDFLFILKLHVCLCIYCFCVTLSLSPSFVLFVPLFLFLLTVFDLLALSFHPNCMLNGNKNILKIGSMDCLINIWSTFNFKSYKQNLQRMFHTHNRTFSSVWCCCYFRCYYL